MARRYERLSLLRNSQYKTINVPTAEDSSAGGINSAGDVVYSWEDDNDNYHGALRHNGHFVNFDYPSAARTFGYGINDHGTVVGAYVDSNGVTKGYKATY